MPKGENSRLLITFFKGDWFPEPYLLAVYTWVKSLRFIRFFKRFSRFASISTFSKYSPCPLVAQCSSSLFIYAVPGESSLRHTIFPHSLPKCPLFSVLLLLTPFFFSFSSFSAFSAWQSFEILSWVFCLVDSLSHFASFTSEKLTILLKKPFLLVFRYVFCCLFVGFSTVFVDVLLSNAVHLKLFAEFIGFEGVNEILGLLEISLNAVFEIGGALGALNGFPRFEELFGDSVFVEKRCAKLFMKAILFFPSASLRQNLTASTIAAINFSWKII